MNNRPEFRLKYSHAIPVLAALFILPLFLPLFSQDEEPPEVDRTKISSYEIQVTLNPEDNTLSGKETLTWVNADGPTVNELKFHLYMNAFKSADTRFFSQEFMPWNEEEAGWININSVRLADGRNITEQAVIDETVMTLPLPEPLAQGQQVRLDIDFSVQLPHIISRAGYSKNYYMIAQWFPKIGVLNNGEWICPQYHTYSEFYSNFGSYRVEITVPKNFEVAATGYRDDAKTYPETKTLIYVADPVHDFAWAASPHFRRVEKSITVTDYQGESHSLSLHLLLMRDRMKLASNYENAVRASLEHFSKQYGQFPYRKLVVIDPGPGRGQLSGGMEYPMLVTGGSSWLETSLLTGDKPIEQVTTHEFGHQYWYGAVASNEFDEAWLDEGLTSFTTNRVADQFGPFTRGKGFLNIYGTSLRSLHPSSITDDFLYYSLAQLLQMGTETDTFTDFRNEYQMQPGMDAINVESYRVSGNFGYQVAAYIKPELMFRTLERMLGDTVLRDALRRYYTTFRFAHPSREDLVGMIEEVAGRDLDWFFDQVIDSTAEIDYSVAYLEPTEILFQRKGEVNLPQDIEVKFADGKTSTFHWPLIGDREQIWMDVPKSGPEFGGLNYMVQEAKDGRWLKIIIPEGKIISAQLDPDYTYLLDTNFANNSKSIEPDQEMSSKGMIRWTRIMSRWLHGVSVYN